MATTEEIRADLAEIVNEVAGVPADDVQLDKSFVDDLDVDSLSMVEVVVAAEEKFGVKIPDDEVKNLKTVGDAVAFIERAQALTTRRRPADRTASHLQSRRTPHDSHRVVVTGLGTTTPVGGDVASTWDALVAGRSGVGALDRRLGRAAAGPDRRPRSPSSPPRCSSGSRPAGWTGPRQFAMVAAMEAWADAGLGRRRASTTSASASRWPPASAASRPCSPTTTRCSRRARAGSRRSPIPMLMPNAPGRQHRPRRRRPGRRAHARSRPAPRATRRSLSAVDQIRLGRADVVVAGGTEAAIHPLPMAAFANMMALSKTQRRPRARSRGRGTSTATASCSARAPACSCSSPRSTPQARGARIYAEVARRRHHRRRPRHRPARPGRSRRHPGDPAGARARPRSAPTTSCTSTRTRRRPRRATSPRA